MQQSRLLDLNGAWTTCQRDNFGERWIGRKAGRGPASGKTLSFAHVAVIWARISIQLWCWNLRLDKAGGQMLTG